MIFEDGLVLFKRMGLLFDWAMLSWIQYIHSHLVRFSEHYWVGIFRRDGTATLRYPFGITAIVSYCESNINIRFMANALLKLQRHEAWGGTMATVRDFHLWAMVCFSFKIFIERLENTETNVIAGQLVNDKTSRVVLIGPSDMGWTWIYLVYNIYRSSRMVFCMYNPSIQIEDGQTQAIVITWSRNLIASCCLYVWKKVELLTKGNLSSFRRNISQMCTRRLLIWLPRVCTWN